MNTLPPTLPQTRPPMISAAPPASSFLRPAALFSFPARGNCILIALAAVLLTAQQGRSQYTVGDMGGWDGSTGIDGITTDSEGGGQSIGQTFQINNGNALVSSISFPIFNDTSSVEFQVGVAAWSGTQPTGSVLYLSDALTPTSVGWQSFTVTPNNLTLSQSQEYVLFFTPNSFLNTDPQFDAGVGYVPYGDYSGGQIYSSAGSQPGVNALFTQPWTGGQADLAFDINYQVVPEPSALMLLCLGGALLWMRYRIQTGFGWRELAGNGREVVKIDSTIAGYNYK